MTHSFIRLSLGLALMGLTSACSVDAASLKTVLAAVNEASATAAANASSAQGQGAQALAGGKGQRGQAQGAQGQAPQGELAQGMAPGQGRPEAGAARPEASQAFPGAQGSPQGLTQGARPEPVQGQGRPQIAQGSFGGAQAQGRPQGRPMGGGWMERGAHLQAEPALAEVEALEAE